MPLRIENHLLQPNHPRKQSVYVMRSMTHARMRINPHGWTQEVTQLRVTLPRICLARHGSHACFQNARFQKIYIFILILISSEKMMEKQIIRTIFLFRKKFWRAIAIVGHTLNEHQLNYKFISMTNIFWKKLNFRN